MARVDHFNDPNAPRATSIVPSVTAVVLNEQGELLLVHRTDNGLWALPGGGVDPGESVTDAVVREVKEETGLDIADVRLCGVCHWVPPDNDHRYIIFLYKTSTFSGELRSSDEGEIFRVKLSELDPAEFSDGFAEMLEVFTDEHLSEVFHWLDGEEWRTKNK